MKMCVYYPSKRCYHSTCSVFDRRSGNVFVCHLHPNPSGFSMPKKAFAVLECSK